MTINVNIFHSNDKKITTNNNRIDSFYNAVKYLNFFLLIYLFMVLGINLIHEENLLFINIIPKIFFTSAIIVFILFNIFLSVKKIDQDYLQVLIFPLEFAILLENEFFLSLQSESDIVVNIVIICIFLIFSKLYFSKNLFYLTIIFNITEFIIFDGIIDPMTITTIFYFVIFVFTILFLFTLFQKNYFDQLNKMEKKYQDSINEDNMLLSKMSHNLKTPLNLVANQVFLLKEKIFDKDPQCVLPGFNNRCHFIDNEIITQVSNLSTSTNQLLETVNEILDYEKINSGHGLVNNAYFNCQEICTNLKEIFDPIVTKKGLKFSITLKKNLREETVLFGNKYHLKQILLNLVDNAIKYTVYGSIEVIVDAINLDKTSNQALSFDINDTGIGIPEDKIKDLFKPFSRVQNILDVTGSGLGLVIVNELLELNNGKITLETKENQGTHFHVEFPVSFPAQTTEIDLTQKNIVEVENFKKLIGENRIVNILVADDFEENQTLLKELLKNYPIKLSFASDGDEALQKIQSETFDLVFLDIRMPRKTGIETILEIRRSEKNSYSGLKVVALTANTMKQEINYYKELGFNAVITKPFTREIIIKSIANLFS